MLSSQIAMISKRQEPAVEMRNEGKAGELPLSWNTSSWKRRHVPVAWLYYVLWIRVHKHKRRRKAAGIALLALSSLRRVDRRGWLSPQFLYKLAIVSKTFLSGISPVPEPGRVKAGHSRPVPRCRVMLRAFIRGFHDLFDTSFKSFTSS